MSGSADAAPKGCFSLAHFLDIVACATWSSGMSHFVVHAGRKKNGLIVGQTNTKEGRRELHPASSTTVKDADVGFVLVMMLSQYPAARGTKHEFVEQRACE